MGSESTFAAHHANAEHHANSSDLVVLKSLELSQDASKRALNETKDLIKAREKWAEAAKEAKKGKRFAVAAKKALVKLSQAQLQRMQSLVDAIHSKVISVKGNLTQRLHIAQNDSVHVKNLFSDKSMDPMAIESAMHTADSSAHVAVLTKRYYQALKARKKVALKSLDKMMGKEDPPEEESVDYSTPILDKLQADVESAVAASNKARSRASELAVASGAEAGSESEAAKSGAESESK